MPVPGGALWLLADRARLRNRQHLGKSSRRESGAFPRRRLGGSVTSAPAKGQFRPKVHREGHPIPHPLKTIISTESNSFGAVPSPSGSAVLSAEPRSRLYPSPHPVIN